MIRALLVAIALLSSVSAEAKDACSGGMSSYYRNVLGAPPVWEHCCTAHDRRYRRGGTSDSRMIADGQLAACVAASGYPVMGAIMGTAVRLGGQMFFPFDWKQYRRDYSARRFYERDTPL